MLCAPSTAKPSIPIFRCPSDPEVKPFGISYSWTTTSARGEGPLAYHQSRQPRDIVDGLSNTTCLSETLAFFAWDDPRVHPLPSTVPRGWGPRFFWTVPTSTPFSIEEFRQQCASATNFDVAEGDHDKGYCAEPLYDHLQTPNQRPCTETGPPTTWLQSFPASSAHSGGVNALFCDGHVQFISDVIDEKVWHAMATIDNQDSIATQ